jgi:hypothetical protein
MKTETCIEPHYRKGSGLPVVVDGVTFEPYRVGIVQYAYVSADGRCETRQNHGAATYSAYVAGVGYINSKSGKPTRFHTERAAMAAAVKIAKRIK